MRKINDQLMLLERSFVDSNVMPNYSDRKHIILGKLVSNEKSSCESMQTVHLTHPNPAPNDGQDHRAGFPGLVDWITLLEGDTLDDVEHTLFVDILKMHYKTIVYTISNSIKVIDDVHII